MVGDSELAGVADVEGQMEQAQVVVDGQMPRFLTRSSHSDPSFRHAEG